MLPYCRNRESSQEAADDDVTKGEVKIACLYVIASLSSCPLSHLPRLLLGALDEVGENKETFLFPCFLPRTMSRPCAGLLSLARRGIQDTSILLSSHGTRSLPRQNYAVEYFTEEWRLMV